MDALGVAGFLTEGFVGHLSYVLLIVSSLMRRMFWLRVFLIASAVTGIAFDWFWLANPVGVFWEGLLLAVNLVQIALLASRDARARFSPEEARLAERWLRGGTPGLRRALLDQGRWETLPAGLRLTRQGLRPDTLTYLAEGEAVVTVAGREVARVGPGQLVGEMSLLDGEGASADVALLSEARAWRIDRDRLDRLERRRPELYGLVEVAVALALRDKLLAERSG